MLPAPINILPRSTCFVFLHSLLFTNFHSVCFFFISLCSLLLFNFSCCSLIISLAPCSISQFLVAACSLFKILYSLLKDYFFIASCFLLPSLLARCPVGHRLRFYRDICMNVWQRNLLCKFHFYIEPESVSIWTP